MKKSKIMTVIITPDQLKELYKKTKGYAFIKILAYKSDLVGTEKNYQYLDYEK